ncbi:hypothetical protein BDD43_3413 [Mucilaginibacter gracilis]|uniref:Uncharacterized protein n=1 Tax=Mucilaginibacter gracilis TaxID=423350 RepID=A0A495J3G1_9SPHI|nr:hypothetical protein [Mucilaginibacter gracilis]RKR83211.1 hypothetical protein BDD43_3413 [Mucilaginibacter gracilis]
MKTEIITCDLCECVLEQKKLFGITFYSVKRQLNGILWRFTYSPGGWGSATQYPSFSGEVCDECFAHYKEQVKQFNSMMDTRKGINKTKILFQNDNQKPSIDFENLHNNI